MGKLVLIVEWKVRATDDIIDFSFGLYPANIIACLSYLLLVIVLSIAFLLLLSTISLFEQQRNKMETIKNLLRPGHAEDDKTLYDQTGSTNTTSKGNNLSGEGSHLSEAREGASHPTSGQGSHFGSSTTTQTGNETLGSTSVGSGGHTGAGQRYVQVAAYR